MSGIVGIINFDGAPIDSKLLRQMTLHMAFRGPDAQEFWTNSHVGLGHAMLRTTFEMAHEQQPRTLDGRIWITADARIDARRELIQKLEAAGCLGLAQAYDADLILNAYRVWNTNCVEHLLGDFSFAIWDGIRKRLFCARDHFGVRPFYYARVGRSLIFSNNLDTIRRHPRVSNRLNDLAIVNFLVFRYQPRIDQTSFADIQSLMPGHTLTSECGDPTIRRYWTLPIEGPIRYKRQSDYIDRFRELLDSAIADRMRTDRAGIQLSGGMDSSSLAATMHSLRLQKKNNFALEAFTYVYERLIPDEEGHYATLVARHLGIPIHFDVLDDKKWFDGWDREGFHFPEPMAFSALWNDDDRVRKAALCGGLRVFYSGLGPDALLNEHISYGTLLRYGCLGELIKRTASFLVRYRRRPLAAAARSYQKLRGIIPERQVDVEALALITSKVAEQIEIPKQWWQFPTSPPKHPWRPSAYASLTNHYWNLCFQSADAANWRAPIEFRYPYFDARLVQYLLRVPVLPWSSNKGVLREAMRGMLPEVVRTRPKTPVSGNAVHSYADWVQRSNTVALQLARYVDTERMIRDRHEQSAVNTPLQHRLISLNQWLNNTLSRPMG